MPDDTRGTDLYRFYDSGNRLLYVGISLNAAHRASEHRGDKGWWPTVARMDVEHIGSRTDAEIAEREAIRRERPLHNVIWNTVKPLAAVSNDIPFEFDATFLLQHEFTALTGAIQQVAKRLDRLALEEPNTPSRATFVATIDALARTAVYGDCCPKCDEVYYPIALKLEGPTWALCAYQCFPCRTQWTCGWTLDLGILAML